MYLIPYYTLNHVSEDVFFTIINYTIPFVWFRINSVNGVLIIYTCFFYLRMMSKNLFKLHFPKVICINLSNFFWYLITRTYIRPISDIY